MEHQRVLDEIRENYTFRKTETKTTFDGKGNIRKVETTEHHDFFVNGHEVQKLISRNSKPLSPSEAQTEEERAMREAQKYATTPPGPLEKDQISVSRMLEIIRFSNERRIQENGRSRIQFDFAGDPHAKTHGRNEEAAKRVYGTIAIDEAARQVVHLNVALDENLHLGFGLFATVEKGSSISFHQGLIRNEVWLPTAFEGHFDGKALLVMGLHMHVTLRYDEYRKFQATATGGEQAEAAPALQLPAARKDPPIR